MWESLKDQPYLPAIAGLIAAGVALLVAYWNGGPAKRARDALKTDVEIIKLLSDVEDKSGELSPELLRVYDFVSARIEASVPLKKPVIEPDSDRIDQYQTPSRWRKTLAPVALAAVAALFTSLGGVFVTLLTAWLIPN